MKYYEILYVVHPALETGRLKDIILSIHTMFEGMGVKILSADVWGKKKLAYLIDKQQYGTYVLVQFESDGMSNSKISTELEHNPNILTYLISTIDSSDIQKDSKSIDEQIIGRVDQSTQKPAKDSKSSTEEAPTEEAPTEEVEKDSDEKNSDTDNKELTNEEK